MDKFFVISYSFIDWLFKRHIDRYVFNMTDDKYPNHVFKVIVERIKK